MLDKLTIDRAASLEESVKEDMRIIRNDPYLPKALEVLGYTYDVFSGKTTEVAVM
jgi:carbonic anhydrase